jgi:O-acetyl-ADP-ribose deacetylase (regulator of RNase III)
MIPSPRWGGQEIHGLFLRCRRGGDWVFGQLADIARKTWSPTGDETMKITVGQSTLELVEGDITQQDTDAIVNAANTTLLGGGGVDGAIHRAGGPQILEECRQLGGCPTGEARLTTGGRLKAGYVIHTVGPVYRGGSNREAELLASCYQESLKLASSKGLASVAFPSISTGAYGYPMAEAARIALKTTMDYLSHHPEITLVRFVLFGRSAYEVYAKELERLTESTAPGD